MNEIFGGQSCKTTCNIFCNAKSSDNNQLKFVAFSETYIYLDWSYLKNTFLTLIYKLLQNKTKQAKEVEHGFFWF
jgi:hypothetical protein